MYRTVELLAWGKVFLSWKGGLAWFLLHKYGTDLALSGVWLVDKSYHISDSSSLQESLEQINKLLWQMSTGGTVPTRSPLSFQMLG